MASSRDCPSRNARQAWLLTLLLVPATSLGLRAQAEAPPASVDEQHAAPATARPEDEAALFELFGKLRGLSASYTEEKHLSLLAVPLTSKGKLYFLAANKSHKAHLVRSVEAPEKSKLTITESELKMAGASGTEVIDLRQSDRVRLFVTSLMRVFQGDRAALKKHYRVRYVLDPARATRWQLELTPEKAPLDKILRRLTLFGDGRAVTRIELLEPSGDRTVTKIDAVDPARTFTAAEEREIFGIQSDQARADKARADTKGPRDGAPTERRSKLR